MPQLDLPSVLRGAAVALAVIIPAVIVVWVADPPAGSSGWGTAYLGVIVVATLAGSAVAGHRQRATPAVHGAVTALITFVVAQLLASVVRGEVPNPLGLLFFALAFMCLGAIGGVLGTVKLFQDREDGPGGAR